MNSNGHSNLGLYIIFCFISVSAPATSPFIPTRSLHGPPYMSPLNVVLLNALMLSYSSRLAWEGGLRIRH